MERVSHKAENIPDMDVMCDNMKVTLFTTVVRHALVQEVLMSLRSSLVPSFGKLKLGRLFESWLP